MRLTLALDAVEFAGAERYVEVLLSGLAADGVRCLVVLPASGDPSLAERLGAHAEVEQVRGLRRRPEPAAARRVRAAVARWHPDVLHLNLTDQGDGLSLVAATVGSAVPLVLTLHNAIPGRAPVRERLSAAVLRRPDRVLAPSRAVAAYVQAGGTAATVVPNGLPRTPAHPAPRASLGLPETSRVVGGVGRLHAQKGWDLLAPVAAALRHRVPGVRVVVLGEGDERAALEALPDAGALELRGARPDAAALMGGFDVLVVPSRYEAFGMVALEAMQAGVPVVATAVDGLPEVLGDAGVLVAPGDGAALLDALERLLLDPRERSRLGAAGRERADALFTPEAMTSATAAVYAGLRGRWSGTR